MNILPDHDIVHVRNLGELEPALDAAPIKVAPLRQFFDLRQQRRTEIENETMTNESQHDFRRG